MMTELKRFLFVCVFGLAIAEVSGERLITGWPFVCSQWSTMSPFWRSKCQKDIGFDTIKRKWFFWGRKTDKDRSISVWRLECLGLPNGKIGRRVGDVDLVVRHSTRIKCDVNPRYSITQTVTCIYFTRKAISYLFTLWFLPALGANWTYISVGPEWMSRHGFCRNHQNWPKTEIWYSNCGHARDGESVWVFFMSDFERAVSIIPLVYMYSVWLYLTRSISLDREIEEEMKPPLMDFVVRKFNAINFSPQRKTQRNWENSEIGGRA